MGRGWAGGGQGLGSGQGWGGLKGRPRMQHNFFFGRVQLTAVGKILYVHVAQKLNIFEIKERQKDGGLRVGSLRYMVIITDMYSTCMYMNRIGFCIRYIRL